MAKNTHDGNNDNFYLTNGSYNSLHEEYASDKSEGDILINDIYLYVGTIVICFIIFCSMITMIRKCIKYYEKDEQTRQSNVLLREVSIIRRNSSIRNSLIPNHRSSLDIQFQMESRARRLSQLYLIPLTPRKI